MTFLEKIRAERGDVPPGDHRGGYCETALLESHAMRPMDTLPSSGDLPKDKRE